MMKVKRWLSLNLFDAALTATEYANMVRSWWRRMKLPYFLPHVWQAMLMGVFGVGGVIGIVGALYLLHVRGLL